MTTWQFFAAWVLFLLLCIGLSYVWAWLRSAEHPLNSSLDEAFAGRRRMLEYAMLMGLALLITWAAWAVARPWWSEPVAPRGTAKPVVIKLDPNTR
jgi:magnesium-transporting ATPase (P-type)